MGGLTFGAIGAALIAAIVSLVGLILGKEQKTSEFRQEWVDSLRSEISDYLTNITAVSDKLKQDFESDTKKIEILTPFYTKINSASFLIRLRLNPEEPNSLSVLEAMDNFENASRCDTQLKSEEIDEIEDELLSSAQVLLKTEWKRVKNGEWTYRIAKCVAFFLTLALATALVLIGLSETNPNTVEDKLKKGVSAHLTPQVVKELPESKGHPHHNRDLVVQKRN